MSEIDDAPSDLGRTLTFLGCASVACLLVGGYADHRFGIDVFGPPRLPIPGLLGGAAAAAALGVAALLARLWGWRPPSALASCGLIPAALIGMCGHRAGGLVGALIGGGVGFAGFQAYYAFEAAKHRVARELGRSLVRALHDPRSERALERRQRVRLHEPAAATISGRLGARPGEGRRRR